MSKKIFASKFQELTTIVGNNNSFQIVQPEHYEIGNCLQAGYFHISAAGATSLVSGVTGLDGRSSGRGTATRTDPSLPG